MGWVCDSDLLGVYCSLGLVWEHNDCVSGDPSLSKEDGFLPGVPHLQIKTRESTSDKLSRLKIETC